MEKFLDSLNNEQKEAVLSTEGPVLIFCRCRFGQNEGFDI
jgi:hypothetical protein